MIDYGIHVFTKITTALLEAKSFGGVAVPVICKASDLVAGGRHDEAVFMKVRIRAAAWNKTFSPKSDKKL